MVKCPLEQSLSSTYNSNSNCRVADMPRVHSVPRAHQKRRQHCRHKQTTLYAPHTLPDGHMGSGNNHKRCAMRHVLSQSAAETVMPNPKYNASKQQANAVVSYVRTTTTVLNRPGGVESRGVNTIHVTLHKNEGRVQKQRQQSCGVHVVQNATTPDAHSDKATSPGLPGDIMTPTDQHCVVVFNTLSWACQARSRANNNAEASRLSKDSQPHNTCTTVCVRVHCR